MIDLKVGEALMVVLNPDRPPGTIPRFARVHIEALLPGRCRFRREASTLHPAMTYEVPYSEFQRMVDAWDWMPEE